MQQSELDNQQASEIRLILRDLLRTIKAVCMYPASNSLPQSLRTSLADRLLDTVEERGDICFAVDKGVLLYGGEIVHRDKSREDNLADIFFSAGITELCFTPSLTSSSVNCILDALREYLTAPQENLDLASMFWEADIDGFTFQTAEDVALEAYDAEFHVSEYFSEDEPKDSMLGTERVEGYAAIFESDGEEDTAPAPPDLGSDATLPPQTLFDVTGEQAERLHADEAARAMGYDDVPAGRAMPDTALILSDELKLSEEEEEQIAGLLERDGAFDMYRSTAELLLEMLLQEKGFNGFHETAVICGKVLSEFIAQGQLGVASVLIQQLGKLADRFEQNRARWSERLRDIAMTAGSRDRLRHVATALNRDETISEKDFRSFLDQFDWQSLGAITDMLGELEYRAHRMALCEYLVERGQGKEEIIAKGIYDKRWYVVRNSVMILGHLGDDRSLTHLKKAVNHEDRRVRIELVVSLKDSGNPKALEVLRPMVGDRDKEIREEALAAIMSHDGAESFRSIAEVVYSRTFLGFERDDQAALLRAYSRTGKEKAVGYLGSLITKFNLLNDDTQTFLRRAAIAALVANPSDRAERLLEKLANSLRPDIRKRAARALRERHETHGAGA